MKTKALELIKDHSGINTDWYGISTHTGYIFSNRRVEVTYTVTNIKGNLTITGRVFDRVVEESTAESEDELDAMELKALELSD